MKLIELLTETELEDNEYFEIPAKNIGYLKDKIAELNKKASKIGAMPIVIHELGEIKKRIDDVTHRFIKVKVIGKSPKIEGWRLVGALDHESGGVVIRVVPGETLPPEFRNTSPTRCDHCNTKRDRVNSYIVVDDRGEYKQVGRSCLKNFLGHADPSKIIGTASMLNVLDNLIGAVSDSEFSGGRNSQIPMKEYLTHVTAVIKAMGWVPKSMAAQTGKTSTADLALSNLFPTPGNNDRIKPTEQDEQTAESAMNWVRNILPNKKTMSEYEHNLVVIGANEYINPKHLGFAASIVSAYNRATENEINRKREAEKQAENPSNYVGEVGQRFGVKGVPPLDLQLLAVRWINTVYGSTGIHRFVDRNGNFFVWFASSDLGLERGNWYKIAASVKNHELDKYNNNAKTTYITRAKVL
ncbi:MAG: hypothetical protein HC836_16680 [Richelia sp. RM2_1_2]|nr:hypothetical protein [Richelia sp. RM2_1_2]